MLGQKLTRQQWAAEQYSRALVAANDKLKEKWDATREQEKKKPRQRFIDEVWPGMKP
ncbi:MAG: hypothetical protein IKG23_07085 [Clostridia bacterium]|nr:hypothetical protein [Clostridia bacterium]